MRLYFHPFASFCQKVLVALYENDVPFEPHVVDLGDEASSAEFKSSSPRTRTSRGRRGCAIASTTST